MKIIIVGAGKIGELLCKDLSTEGNDITLIEENPKILDRILSSSDIMGLEGNGTNCEILKEAYIETADIFIAVTHSDEINIISSIMAKKLGAKYTIARVRNPEYSSQMKFMSESLGIDMMINPESEAAYFITRNLQFPNALNVESFAGNKVNMVEVLVEKNTYLDMMINPESEAAYFITRNLQFPNALNVESFAGNKVNMVEVLVEKNTYLDGLKLKDFKHNHFSTILVCIVQRGQEVYIPTGNFVLEEGDRIYVTGGQSQLSEFYKSLGHKEERIKSVLIIGGGKISHYLVEQLLNKKMKVKVIEINEEKALALSETFEHASVICGDGTNSQLLDEERITEFDACISLTGIDEENIILSMYANKMGVKKTITKINGISLFNFLELDGLQSIVTPKKLTADNIVKKVRSLINSQGENIETLYRIADNKVEAIEFGLQSIVTPKKLTADNIVKKVRSLINSQGENIETLYRIADNKVEAIEFKLPKDSSLINVPLKELPIKENVLITYIIRNNELIFPGGSDILLENDRIIIVTTEKYLNDVNKILR